MMKKRLLILLAVVCVAALCLCACGGSGDDPTKGGGEQKTIDTGIIATVCPAGWMYFQQTDMFGETDADGNYPVDPTKMAFIKGGESEWDLFTKPVVYLNYFEDQITDETIEWAKILMDETTDSTIAVQGTDCKAFTGKSLVESDKDYWENTYIFFPAGSGYIQINVPLHCGEAAGVSLDDPDVKAIIDNIKVTK